MAYVTTETGVVTMIIMVVVAGYLLTRRAADFAKAEPKSPRPTNEPGAAARPAGRTSHARSAARRTFAVRVPLQSATG